MTSRKKNLVTCGIILAAGGLFAEAIHLINKMDDGFNRKLDSIHYSSPRIDKRKLVLPLEPQQVMPTRALKKYKNLPSSKNFPFMDHPAPAPLPQ